MSGPRATARRRAREVVFRVAYQAGLLEESYAAVWRARVSEERLRPDPQALVDAVVAVLESRAMEVDAELRDAAEHWPLERLAATDRAVLRAAVAELLGCPGSPARVVIDEAIEIARRYGSEDSGRFVNGVLDRVARRLRPAEF